MGTFSRTSNAVLSNLPPAEVYIHLDYDCFSTNLASGVVKQNHLLRLYLKPNSVSYSLVVQFIWPSGAPTESAEMPHRHFTSDLQPPTLEAGFISDKRLSPVKNKAVCNAFTC